MVTVTTKDNPYNPFTHFEEWYAFDTRMGYNTSSYLARVARTSPDLPPADYEQAIEDAVNDILKYDVLDMYRKVEKIDPPSP